SAKVDGNPDLSTKTTQLSASQRALWFISPYRITIQQGNFISQEMMAQVKTGMTKDQARFILGTPLLNDVFHGERWDYPFRLQKGSGETTTSRIALYFKDGKIDRIESGDLPTENEYLSRIAGPAPSGK
ncbi:MAG: outer membrane protein assembly factor BamE, partial [Burkholderiales bacterium]|nr:outer membrane protein assembly factor BamE [Burkholderiales bacterium]